MGAMEDGWKRIIRKLQTASNEARGYISLKVVGEDLGLVAQNVWASPTSAIVIEESKYFEYVDGELVYTGVPDAYVRLDLYQTLSVDGNNSVTAEGTGGLNGVPCEDGSVWASSAFDGEVLIVGQCRMLMSTGDKLNAYVRQTSEVGSVNITIDKAVYHVSILDII